MDGVGVLSDWLVKLQISFVIYLRVTQDKIVSRFASVMTEEIIHGKFIFCGVYYLTVLVYAKTTIHLSVGG